MVEKIVSSEPNNAGRKPFATFVRRLLLVAKIVHAVKRRREKRQDGKAEFTEAEVKKMLETFRVDPAKGSDELSRLLASRKIIIEEKDKTNFIKSLSSLTRGKDGLSKYLITQVMFEINYLREHSPEELKAHYGSQPIAF